MKWFLLLVLIAAGCLPCSAAETALKIATVDMQELFKQHPLSVEAGKELNLEGARVQKDNNERAERIRGLETQLNSLQKQIEDTTLNEAKRKALFKDWQMRQQEGVAMERERVEFHRRRMQAINERMVVRMKEILGAIREVVAEQAKRDGYDHVLDSSGLSTSQVPILLYSKDATDITAVLLQQIGAAKPVEGASSPPRNKTTCNRL